MEGQLVKAVTPPHSAEMEASVLGAILIDKDALVKIADLLDSSDFYDQRHSRIYEAAVALYDRRSPIDVLTLANQLQGTGFLEMIGGPSYLTELTNYVPTAAHVTEYAKLVLDKAVRRHLMQMRESLADLAAQ